MKLSLQLYFKYNLNPLLANIKYCFLFDQTEHDKKCHECSFPRAHWSWGADPGLWVGTGSGSLGRNRIRVFGSEPDPGLRVGTGSGSFGRSRIRVFGSEPNPGLWFGAGSGSLGRNRIRVLGSEPDPGFWVGTGSGALGGNRIRGFGSEPDPGLWVGTETWSLDRNRVWISNTVESGLNSRFKILLKSSFV